MTDKELLKLAAKAAGIELDLVWQQTWDFDGTAWNPLTDDGDALRLAVKLGLNITIDVFLGGETEVSDYGAFCAKWSQEDHKDDPYAATRRAIVRAAAEIGKQNVS